MLIILLLVGIGLIILGCIVCYSRNCKIEYGLGVVFNAVGAVVVIGAGLFTTIAVTNTIKIPQMEQRIAIYEEENTRIEEQIKTTIQVYQDYEKDILGDIDLDKISSEKLILLTSIYPELKSDAMVQELIQVYIDNNNQLKELKTSKLDYELWRWWLFFG